MTEPIDCATLGAMNEHAPPAARRATCQDVIDAPPHMVAEIANGALHLHPRPALRHSQARRHRRPLSPRHRGLRRGVESMNET